MRCLALAMALRERGARSVFVVEPGGAAIMHRFGPRPGAGFGVVEVDPEVRLLVANSLGADAAVFDNYHWDAEAEAGVTAPIVMAIDDLADRPHRVNLLLDPGYGREVANYAALVGSGTQLLLGPSYALVRPGFVRTEPKSVPETVSRVFISFGLSDIEGVAARVVRELMQQAPEVCFDVAVAGNAESLPALLAMAAANRCLTVHIDADTAPLMRAADAAVGAGGAMTWERRALGLPSLAVIVADNQRATIQRLAADGVLLAVDLHKPEFETRMAETFARLLDPVIRRAMIDNPLAPCDGQGAARAAEVFLEMIAGVS